MKKVLITGATGFIASHLVEALAERYYDVRVFVHYNSRSDLGLLRCLPLQILDKLDIVWGDLRDSDSVTRAVKGMDIVFHLGALIAIPYSYEDPSNYVQTNIVGTTNILNACLRSSVQRLIHTSTSEVYGTACYKPIDEKHPLQAQSPYAASKLAADKLALSYYMSFDLPVSVIRPFNCFGPRQSLRAIIPTILSQAIFSDEILVGNVEVSRDWTFISDLVDGFIKLAETSGLVGEVINIGTGKERSVAQVIKAIEILLDKKLKVTIDKKRFRPQKSEVYSLIADNSKAEKLIGWKSTVSFEDGLKKTIDWVKSNPSIFKNKEYVI
ncbi:MAG: NAD-dependent dehydratase [Deltaproteobacteria bacterium CG07_land_8_20_14_0_80_38_7]|nr:MAG: NAD-dependent dehydratase [Deltaproteobacteria bacterium CG07_land_8_20_14_0_80_38_7]